MGASDEACNGLWIAPQTFIICGMPQTPKRHSIVNQDIALHTGDAINRKPEPTRSYIT